MIINFIADNTESPQLLSQYVYPIEYGVVLPYEATVSKISEDNLLYLMSRGISREKATELIILGFIDNFKQELPMEYAVELNRLLKE